MTRATEMARPHPLLADFGYRFVTRGGNVEKPDLSELLALSPGVTAEVSYRKYSINVTITALQRARPALASARIRRM